MIIYKDLFDVIKVLGKRPSRDSQLNLQARVVFRSRLWWRPCVVTIWSFAYSLCYLHIATFMLPLLELPSRRLLQSIFHQLAFLPKPVKLKTVWRIKPYLSRYLRKNDVSWQLRAFREGRAFEVVPHLCWKLPYQQHRHNREKRQTYILLLLHLLELNWK